MDIIGRDKVAQGQKGKQINGLHILILT